MLSDNSGFLDDRDDGARNESRHSAACMGTAFFERCLVSCDLRLGPGTKLTRRRAAPSFDKAKRFQLARVAQESKSEDHQHTRKDALWQIPSQPSVVVADSRLLEQWPLN